jgi:hypothetical protein
MFNFLLRLKALTRNTMELIERQDEVIHAVVNEMYAKFKEDKVLVIEKFIRKKFRTDFEFLSEPDRIAEIMEEKGLVTRNKTTGLAELTNFGKNIAESKDGWLGYLNKKNELSEKRPTVIVKNEKQWYDAPLKIVALVEGVVIIIATILALNMQSNSKQLEKEKQQISDTLVIRNQKLYDLEGLLKTKDKDIEELEENLKALRDSLNVKK